MTAHQPKPGLDKFIAACVRVEPRSGTNVESNDAPGKPFEQLRQYCEAQQPQLLGGSLEEKTQINSWLSYPQRFDDDGVKTLDDHLLKTSFLAGHRLTLADLVIYYNSADYVQTAKGALTESAPNFARWYDQLQHTCRNMSQDGSNSPPLVDLHLHQPTPIPLPPKPPVSAARPVGAAANSNGAEGMGKGGAAKESQQAQGPASKAAKAGKDEGVAADGQRAGSKKKDKPKKEGKEPKAPVQEASGGAGGDDADPSKLDMRVGLILKAWPHPEADKLYCEEIDLGEEKPRTIASGLRPFYSLEDMQNRRVVVLANLKPRTMVGFKSEGMVMCASNADHTVVKFVEPPADAPLGARVTVQGKEGVAATPAQLQKKKILEKCLPHLATDNNGTPGFAGSPFIVEGFGTCKSPVPGASVA